MVQVAIVRSHGMGHRFTIEALLPAEHRAGHRSTDGAPLSACTQQGTGLISEPIISPPTVGEGLTVAYFVSTHSWWQVPPQNHTSLVDSPWGGVHSGSFPSGSAPVLLTLHHSLELDMGQTSPGRGLP